VLDEAALVDQSLEFLVRDVVVVDGRGLRVVWETENMNFCGCAAKRRFRRVDLPVPEGPEMTIGCGVGLCVRAIVAVVRRWAVKGRMGWTVRGTRRGEVVLMVERSLEGLRERVRRARVIRSLS